MKKIGEINYQGKQYRYELDENKNVWLIPETNMRVSIGQIRPLNEKDNLEEVVLDMLINGGL